MGSAARSGAVTLVLLSASLVVATWLRPDVPRSAAAPEPSPRVPVPRSLVTVDDGDSVSIRWPEGPEVVRLLGIDAPETIHLEHDIPYPQPFGDAAAGFLAGLLAHAGSVELLRAPRKDAFGRTLGYLFVDGKNVSVLSIEARMAVETVSRYGTNGCPEESAACTAAAKVAGPVAFEDPHLYRKRMHAVSRWLKGKGLYPRGPEDGGK